MESTAVFFVRGSTGLLTYRNHHIYRLPLKDADGSGTLQMAELLHGLLKIRGIESHYLEHKSNPADVRVRLRWYEYMYIYIL